jgi:hypothetical protein
MRRFPVVNLGQIKRFEVLTDQQIISACKAVNTFNDWEDWQDTPTGESARRDSISALQNIIKSRPGFERGAVDEIREYCPDADAILDYIPQPWLTGTPPVIPTGPNVASVDPYGPFTPTPPPNTNPPVATGQPGPGRGAFEPRPTVQSFDFPFHRPYTPPETEPTGFTGSEQEPEPVPTPTPTPKPFTPPPPMVPTGGEGCWYTPGQGYSWGARPSGSETTGLNKSDCENLMRYDREIRGQAINLQPQTAPAQATQFTQESQPMTQATAAPNMQPTIQTPPNVQSTMCPPGQFWDGRQCRGSVAPGFGNLMSIANMGPSGGVSAPTFGGEGFSSGGAPGAFSMAGRKYRVVNLF